MCIQVKQILLEYDKVFEIFGISSSIGFKLKTVESFTIQYLALAMYLQNLQQNSVCSDFC